MSYATPRGSPTDNLLALRDRKNEKLGLLMRRQRKLGQLKAWNEAAWLAGREIEKEERELALIEEDLKSLGWC